MSATDAAALAFVVAAAAHAGFQVTVTALVYPALVRVVPERWEQAHARHSRGIGPLVAVLYAALAVTSVLLALHHHGLWAWAGVGGAWGAMLVTATAAAPIHARLATPEPPLLRRLLVVDRWRTGLACLAVLGAVLTAVAG